jgi:hypothetical protein
LWDKLIVLSPASAGCQWLLLQVMLFLKHSAASNIDIIVACLPISTSCPYLQ